MIGQRSFTTDLERYYYVILYVCNHRARDGFFSSILLMTPKKTYQRKKRRHIVVFRFLPTSAYFCLNTASYSIGRINRTLPALSFSRLFILTSLSRSRLLYAVCMCYTSLCILVELKGRRCFPTVVYQS